MLALLMFAVPTLLVIALQPGVLRSIILYVLPGVQIGTVSVSGFNRAAVEDVRVPVASRCLVLGRIAVLIAPTSALSWAFGLGDAIVVYSVDVTGAELVAGPCNFTVMLGDGTWALDLEAAAAVLLDLTEDGMRLLPSVMDSAMSVIATVERIACAVSIDLNRMSVESADGLYAVYGMALAEHATSATWSIYASYSGAPTVSVAFAYRASDACSRHEFALQATTRSYGGVYAGATCSGAAARGLACDLTAGLNLWRVGTASGRVAFYAQALDATSWLAYVDAGVTAPLGLGTATVALAAAAVRTNGTSVSAALRVPDCGACGACTAGGPAATRAGAWTLLRGTVAALAELNDSHLVAKLPSQTGVVLDSGVLTVDGPCAAVTGDAGPNWTTVASIGTAHAVITARDRDLRICGSTPLPPFDGSGAYRLLINDLDVALTNGSTAMTVEQLLFEAEDADLSSTVVWVADCAGSLVGTSGILTFGATCANASIVDIARFGTPSVTIRLRGRGPGVNISLSSDQVVLESGRTLTGLISVEVTVT
ncbi:MAG: hypothetical protein M0R22_11930 [Dehalococcoidia bacterium]|nr:hypothetical protein [Dehalococcoidia bacterium]